MRIKSNERGAIGGVALSLIVAVLLLLISVGFGAWAYMSQQDYKNNSDKKSEKAVAIAVEKTKSEKDNEFIEKEKEPLRAYKGSASLGSISFMYPKTWSTSYKDSERELSLIMHPLAISQNDKSLYALRVEVVSQGYDNLVTAQNNNVKKGTVRATPFSLAKLPNVVGIRFDGQLTRDKNGSMILLPLRDKTLRISTESPDYVGDLNKYILPGFTYNP